MPNGPGILARSSANVQAGAKTKMSRVLHGVWLLAFALLLPQVLALIPISVLAGVVEADGNPDCRTRGDVIISCTAYEAEEASE